MSKLSAAMTKSPKQLTVSASPTQLLPETCLFFLTSMQEAAHQATLKYQDAINAANARQKT
jgi:hypothetical protein